MMTYSGGGPAFIALPPPKRSSARTKSPLSPTTPLCVTTKTSPSSSTATATQSPSTTSTPLSPSSTSPAAATDAAHQIESLLHRARPASSSPQHSAPPLLSGIGEDEWTRGFPEGREVLSSFYSDTSNPLPTSQSARNSIDGLQSFYTPGSSSSSINTVRVSIDDQHQRPPRTPKSVKSAGSVARKLLRIARQGSGSGKGEPAQTMTAGGVPGTDPVVRNSLEGCSLNASHRLQEQVALKRNGSGRTPKNKTTTPPALVEDIYIAIIGAPGVGKSTFVLRAYDLNAPPKKGEWPGLMMTVDGARWNVKLVEMEWGMVDLGREMVGWPRLPDVPFIDGVCVLYDVTDSGSFAKVPEALDAFSKAALPVCLVSAKCDLMNRQPQAQSVRGANSRYEQLQTSVVARESQKLCVATILGQIADKKIDNHHHHHHRQPNGRRRANSSAVSNRASSPRPVTAGHSRASSEFPSSFLRDTSTTGLPSRTQGTALGTLALHQSSQRTPPSPISAASRKPPYPGLSSPYLEIVSHPPFSMQSPSLSSSASLQPTSSQSSLPSHTGSTSDRRRESYMSADEDSLTYFDSDEVPILDRESEDGTLWEGAKPAVKGWTFDELVDRLMNFLLVKTEHEFARTFLLVYRRFATPSELLNAFIVRFEAAEEEEEEIEKLERQLRYCVALHLWVSTHPGDCAGIRVRKRLVEFLTKLGRQRNFAILANEMFDVINKGIPDEDLDWAKPEPEEINGPTTTTTTTSLSPSASQTHLRTLQLPCTTANPSKRSSETSYDSLPSTTSSISALPKLPTPSPQKPLTSLHDEFLKLTTTEIATELTRLDWTDLTHITARQILRHQSLPVSSRSSAPNLHHLNTLIKRFNHIAFLVARVVLEKPKPRHRAEALERWMDIAWELRHMNNYNSLAAVIAGVNSTPLHRLSQTHALVNPETRKRFMRMELLMATHKGHTKYRLAWENTRTERIPAIPILRRDLVTADEGNKTWVGEEGEGGRVNWNKFQVMGEIVGNVVGARERGYNCGMVCTVVGRMLEEARGEDEDGLYERSVKLEPVGAAGAAGTGTGRRRLWFKRQV
ncbi:ras GEF [Ascodesmis nigricans]|uniref:Ras GEF n=1 Tax=Ascodesmis nigricans TaxID=341454 RepID=A0A4S2MTG4_9PEZI|nr:ras GEF [Ascodesmis nigricans]